MNYTKGEWEARGRQVYRLDTSYEILECPIWSWMAEGEPEANANLIAAAPAMYNACKVGLDLVKSVLHEHPDDAIAISQKHLIEQALAKAEGEKEEL